MNISFDMEPILLHLDGISDTTDVLSRFLTYGSNVIGNRLSSISHYGKALDKFNKLINGLLELIPDEIDLPKSDLYLEGGLASNFKIKENTYMLIPLDLSLQNHKFPFDGHNGAVFGDYIQEDY
jgi:hypothetical protein